MANKELLTLKFSGKTYVSNVDSGTLYEYNQNGQINKSLKIGEHISDFDCSNNAIYVTSYFDNKITMVKDLYIENTINLKYVPQKIRVNEYVYVFNNDGYYGIIELYSLDLKYIKSIRILNLSGELYYVCDKLIVCGFDYIYIFSKTLNTYSIRKSTGKGLCQYDYRSFIKTE